MSAYARPRLYTSAPLASWANEILGLACTCDPLLRCGCGDLHDRCCAHFGAADPHRTCSMGRRHIPPTRAQLGRAPVLRHRWRLGTHRLGVQAAADRAIGSKTLNSQNRVTPAADRGPAACEPSNASLRPRLTAVRLSLGAGTEVHAPEAEMESRRHGQDGCRQGPEGGSGRTPENPLADVPRDGLVKQRIGSAVAVWKACDGCQRIRASWKAGRVGA